MAYTVHTACTTLQVSSVAAKGNPVEAINQLTAVIDLQREIARALLPADHPELIVLESTFSCDSVKLASVLQTLSLLRGAADEACGYICGMGELWSSRTLTAVLIAMGATACMLDAREVLTVADGGTARLGVKGAAMDMATDVLYEVRGILFMCATQRCNEHSLIC
jgi:aspartokinase